MSPIFVVYNSADVEYPVFPFKATFVICQATLLLLLFFNNMFNIRTILTN